MAKVSLKCENHVEKVHGFHHECFYFETAQNRFWHLKQLVRVLNAKHNQS